MLGTLVFPSLKQRIMKKLFIIAAAACVTLASCVKNEPVATPDLGELITFEAPIVAPATKAGPVGDVLYPADGEFFLYGWYHAAVDGAFANKYIPGAEIAKVEGKNYFAPATSYYWPKSGYLSFFAYSPSALPAGGDGSLSASEMALNKSMTLTYTVPSTQAKQVDLLYSDWAMNQTVANEITTTQGSYNGVEIVFNHALSAVIFSFSGVENMYQINSVTLTGVKKTAVLTSTPASAIWATPTGDVVTYTILPEGTYAVSGAATASEMLMLIPQSLADAKLTINYSLKNPSANEWIAQEAKVINLNTATIIVDEETEAIAKWDMGTKYTYNVTFGAASVIKFAPSIKTEWTGVTGTIPEIN